MKLLAQVLLSIGILMAAGECVATDPPFTLSGVSAFRVTNP